MKVREAALAHRRMWIATPNMNWMGLRQKHPAFADQIRRADFSTADGNPLVKLARRAGAALPQRVAGSDLFDRVGQDVSGRPLSVFFFGGRKGSAEEAANVLAEKYPGYVSAGALNPGFGKLEELSRPSIIEQLNMADPDILVVSLGALRTQAWIDMNRDRLTARILAPFGAVVDFVSGNVARAPAPLRRVGLEFAWRITQDIKLFNRYLSDAGQLPSLAKSAGHSARALAQVSKRDVAAPQARFSQDRLTLFGDHTSAALEEARAALTEYDSQTGNMTVEIRGDCRGDLRLIGFLLIAQQRAFDAGRQFVVLSNDPGWRALLTLNGLNLSSAEIRSEYTTVSPQQYRDATASRA